MKTHGTVRLLLRLLFCTILSIESNGFCHLNWQHIFFRLSSTILSTNGIMCVCVCVLCIYCFVGFFFLLSLFCSCPYSIYTMDLYLMPFCQRVQNLYAVAIFVDFVLKESVRYTVMFSLLFSFNSLLVTWTILISTINVYLMHAFISLQLQSHTQQPNITCDCHARISVVVYRHIFSALCILCVWVCVISHLVDIWIEFATNRKSNQIKYKPTLTQYWVCCSCHSHCCCGYCHETKLNRIWSVKYTQPTINRNGNRNKWAGSTIARLFYVGERKIEIARRQTRRRINGDTMNK